jgi:hypothetical protein
MQFLDSAALAALTAEREMRQRVVNAVSLAAEALAETDGHPLCLCQRVALTAALEASCSGLAIYLFEDALVRSLEDIPDGSEGEDGETLNPSTYEEMPFMALFSMRVDSEQSLRDRIAEYTHTGDAA